MSRGLSKILEKLDLNTQGSEIDHLPGPMKSSKNDQSLDDDGNEEEYRYESGVSSKGLCYESDDEENPQAMKGQRQQTIKWKEDPNQPTIEIDANLSNSQFSQLRKRRRSSARFLRMSGRFNEENLTDVAADGEESGGKHEHLGEMYREVIRMNAENKINASNSWSLRLIDNIDKFLEDEGSSHDQAVHKPSVGTGITTMSQDGRNESTVTNTAMNENEKRINFTKASCTIDASVKIYSYRVDDVYLSSYKVLANLNRSDGKTAPSPDSDRTSDDEDLIHPASDEGKSERVPSQKKTKERHSIKTLEENMANINITKLDYAFDIDPLFHKMSQQFDEGGAKGLLLVNLGVANDSCRLVLDSREDTVSDFAIDADLVFDDDTIALDGSNFLDTSYVIENHTREDEKNDLCENEPRHEGTIDITNLRDKLQELILIAPLESIELVPQLTELRSEYESLRLLGFSDIAVSQAKSNRYADDEEEEKAAEREIHKEALERSRISLNRSSFLGKGTPNDGYIESESYSDDDVGAFGMNDYNDDDFDDTDMNPPLGHSPTMTQDNFDEIDLHLPPGYRTASELDQPHVSNDALSDDLLDAVCSGHILPSQSTFSFFNGDSLKKLTSGNVWAGSSHWKGVQKPKVKDNAETSRKKRKNTTKKKRDVAENSTISTSFVDLYASIQGSMSSSRQPTKRKGKVEDPLGKLKEKMITDKHILPIDAGITVDHLASLFLRPDINFTNESESHNFLRSGRDRASNVEEGHETNVGFFSNDGHDESFGGDSYDGPAYGFADGDGENFFASDDFQVEELQDIRKVQKVEVAHSTVSKKVDVKRLKTNLWTEIDSRLPSKLPDIDSPSSIDHSSVENSDVVSFRDTVRELSSSQTQGDVSFAFYFICILHLANENDLQLENSDHGLSDFFISRPK